MPAPLTLGEAVIGDRLNAFLRTRKDRTVFLKIGYAWLQ